MRSSPSRFEASWPEMISRSAPGSGTRATWLYAPTGAAIPAGLNISTSTTRPPLQITLHLHLVTDRFQIVQRGVEFLAVPVDKGDLRCSSRDIRPGAGLIK